MLTLRFVDVNRRHPTRSWPSRDFLDRRLALDNGGGVVVEAVGEEGEDAPEDLDAADDSEATEEDLADADVEEEDGGDDEAVEIGQSICASCEKNLTTPPA